MSPARAPLCALLLAAHATLAADEPGPTPEATESYRTVVGRVVHVDSAASRLVLDAGGHSVEVAYDRNTAIFLDRRLGTIRDVVPGARVRASVARGGLAAWLEVREEVPPVDGQKPTSEQ